MTADQKHRRIAAETGRTPSLQRDDESFDDYQRRMRHGKYSETVISEIGREFGNWLVESDGGSGPHGRLWNVRCKECGDVRKVRGGQIRREASGKREPLPCRTCVTLAA